jgi:hypothetical protein
VNEAGPFNPENVILDFGPVFRSYTYDLSNKPGARAKSPAYQSDLIDKALVRGSARLVPMTGAADVLVIGLLMVRIIVAAI